MGRVMAASASEWKRSSMCEGKASFDNFTLASSVARRRRRSGKARQAPYKCHVCRRWHLGTAPRHWEPDEGDD